MNIQLYMSLANQWNSLIIIISLLGSKAINVPVILSGVSLATCLGSQVSQTGSFLPGLFSIYDCLTYLPNN